MRVLFHLGRNPELSIAEIARILTLHGLKAGNPYRSGSALCVDLPGSADFQSWFWELGGTIRIAEQVCRLDNANPEHVLDSWLAADPLDDLSPGRSCIGFSLLCDPNSDDPQDDDSPGRALRQILRQLGEGAKERFAKEGRSLRFILPRDDSDVPWLSSAQAGEAKLHRDGRDLLIARDLDGLALYRTIWIQDYEGQSQRDYGRPHRDTVSGLLPPQLARIFVNLARDSEQNNLLDPFCGTGGVLSEGWLLKQNITGADQDFQTVRYARANLKWLSSQKQFSAPEGEDEQKMRWIQSDVRKLRNVLAPLSISSVATEPYLGPPQRGPLPENIADSLIEELTDLYIEALAEIRSLVRPGGRVVFVVPSFKVRGQEKRAIPRLAREVDLLGYRKLNPYEGLDLGPPKHLEYARQGQVVGRRVLLLCA